MRLIDRKNLLKEFSQRLTEAKQVDIAVAWACPCDALEALADSAGNGTSIRIAVGTSGNITNPTTLRRLQDFANLRIASSTMPHGIFHPKYYCFRGPGRTVCWIGSANLTRGGFGENDELVHEFDDSTKEGRRWFKTLWGRLEPDPGPEIDEYEIGWQPPQRGPRPKRDLRPPPQGDMPDRVLLANGSTWNAFVEQLRELDDYWYEKSKGSWNVLGDTHSWLHTISIGREVVRLPNWANLTQRECYILRGFNQEEGAWGLLGTLGGAGQVTTVFNPDRMPDVGPIRMELHGYVNQVLNSNYNQIAQSAHAAVQAIMEIDGFGPAAATRLLTFARPDCLVSVNGQSAAELGGLSGLPQNPGPLANRYEELLNWVYEQPWFKTPQPDDPLERTIWNNRAALLDAFVYEGNDV